MYYGNHKPSTQKSRPVRGGLEKKMKKISIDNLRIWTPKMSSREIAHVIGTTHDSVLKTIRALISRGVVSGNETPYVHPQNQQTYKEFHLDYRNTMVLVSGYNPELRARIVDRWLELETQAAPPAHIPAVPKTFREALLLAADQQEQIERQQAQIEQDAPKVAALAMISEKDGDLGIRDTGRELGVGQNVVRELILARGWACIQGKDPRPAYYGLKHGYTRLVARPYTDRVTGQEKVTDDFKITRKGITRLAEIIAAEKRG